MNSEELQKILDEHRLWLDGEGGSRADLRRAVLCGADLRRADLCGADLRRADLRRAVLSDAVLSRAVLSDAVLSRADLSRAVLSDAVLSDVGSLWGCVGNQRQIKTLFICEQYQITYTAEHLQIGCEKHVITDWWKFDDARIFKMDGDKAINFWAEWKDTLRMLIEKSPAIPGKTEESEKEQPVS